MSNFYLPEDVLIPVFVRLPPKSLGRFKCVSKSLNALISSQEFMELHQKQVISIYKKPNIIIVSRIPDVNHPRKEACYQQLHLLEYSTTGENMELSSKIQLLDHPFDYLKLCPWLEARMVGSCNGLVCQFLRLRPAGGEYDIFLCNPLTKSLWNLPQRPVVVNDDGSSTNKLLSFCGFGYDDFHDDYKVMVGSTPSYSLSLVNGYDYEFQVYSLRSNAWSNVRSYVDARYYMADDIYGYDTCPGAFVNCALHWVLMNGPPNDFDNHVTFSVLAFDLRTNKTKIFQLPDKIHREHTFHLCTLSVLNGCLVLNTSADPTSSYDVHLWVMNDYGLKDSWTKITIHNSPLLCSLSPVDLLEDNHKGKLIYYHHRKGTILSFDLVSHQILEFPISRRLRNAIRMFHFVGSLIQPHPPSSGYKKAYRLDMKTYAEPQGRNPKKRPNPPVPRMSGDVNQDPQ